MRGMFGNDALQMSDSYIRVHICDVCLVIRFRLDEGTLEH